MDACTIISKLSADELRRRLDTIEAERRAVMLLLRAARAKERHQPASPGEPRGKAVRRD